MDNFCDKKSHSWKDKGKMWLISKNKFLDFMLVWIHKKKHLISDKKSAKLTNIFCHSGNN